MGSAGLLWQPALRLCIVTYAYYAYYNMTMHDRLTMETLQEDEEILWYICIILSPILCMAFLLLLSRGLSSWKKKSDYFGQVCQENYFTKCLQMQFAQLTVCFWGCSLLLGWLLPKHLLHYVLISAFQHPPVVLAQLLLSSVPTTEVCGKKYIKG